MKKNSTQKSLKESSISVLQLGQVPLATGFQNVVHRHQHQIHFEEGYLQDLQGQNYVHNNTGILPC